MKKLLLTTVLLGLAIVASASDLPNPRMTPGAVNPDITQANIHQTVCVKGFTKTIRPPAYYTNRLKKEQISAYGYLDTDPKHYEEDHLIALSIGGNPTDARNLWPQPRDSQWGAAKKDQLEFVMYKMLCTGEISLAQAQHDMATNWIDAYKRYVPGHSNWNYSGGAD